MSNAQLHKFYIMSSGGFKTQTSSKLSFFFFWLFFLPLLTRANLVTAGDSVLLARLKVENVLLFIFSIFSLDLGVIISGVTKDIAFRICC